jgi:hypothetical protein
MEFVCRKCSVPKTADAFYIIKGGRNVGGPYLSSCKQCAKKAKAEYRSKPENKAKERETGRAYRAKNIERERQTDRERYWANPAKQRERVRKYHAENIEKRMAYARCYRAAKRDELIERKKQTYRENPEPARRFAKEYYRRNREARKSYTRQYIMVNRESHLLAKKSWRDNNPHKGAEYCARRRAAEDKAMPQWADRKEMAKIYRKAKTLGLSVDHIVPLQSPVVCGLHAHTNLVILPKRENQSKGNRWWPDMPSLDHEGIGA